MLRLKTIIFFIFLFISSFAYSQNKNMKHFIFGYSSSMKMKDNGYNIYFVKKPNDYDLCIIYEDTIKQERMVVIDNTWDKKTDIIYLYTLTDTYQLSREKNTEKVFDYIFALSDKIIKREYKYMEKAIKKYEKENQ